MEKQYVITQDGQEVRDEDLNMLGEMAGLMDDRVFAELFHPRGITSGTVSKYVVPVHNHYYTPALGNGPARGTEIVYSDSTLNLGNATLTIFPFRAMIGSVTPYATDAKKWHQGTRSTVHIGTTTPYTSVPIAANASGNPRIDLIYATITPDVNSAGVSRKVKNPSTGVVTTSSISVSKTTTVSIAIAQGTPGASPTAATIPADGGGNYYIPLAYVRVPNNFGPTSTVANTDILQIAPCINLSPVTGASSVRAATENVNLTASRLSSWGSSGTRPNYQLPSTMMGEEVIWLVLDATDASSANWSHADKANLDTSRDWRNRIFTWEAYAGSTVAWKKVGSPSNVAGQQTTPYGGYAPGSYANGWGQSFFVDGFDIPTGYNIESGARLVAHLSQASCGLVLGSGGTEDVVIYVSSVGHLRWNVRVAPEQIILLKITASPAFHN